MLATRAPEPYGQITLAFSDVVRQQVLQQPGDTIQELFGLREAAYEPGNLRIFSGLVAKLRNKMRIGQKANIKNQIGIERHAILESEAET